MSHAGEKPFVIGAGFGRTGTMSLKVALDKLGFGPCYHMVEVMNNKNHVQLWIDHADGKKDNLELILQGYNSAVDWPTVTYYKELLALHPNAKVVLTTRDPESWYASCIATIFASSRSNLIVSLFFPQIGRFVRMVQKIVWKGTFGDNFANKDHALAVYNRHVEEVRATVPPEQLLEFSVKEGWAPLCKFLDVPTPHGPFPNVNDQQEFQRRMAASKRRTFVRLGLGLAVVGVGAFVLAGFFLPRPFSIVGLRPVERQVDL